MHFFDIEIELEHLPGQTIRGRRREELQGLARMAASVNGLDWKWQTLIFAEGRSDDDFSSSGSTSMDGPSKGRIVVADDDSTIRVYLRGLLRARGYSVVEAANGNEALRHVRNGGVSLVITDIIMPEREGLETIRILRREHRAIEVIAISGATNPEYLKMARVFGAFATLAKPIEPQALLAAVAKALQKEKAK